MERTEYMQSLMNDTYSSVAIEAIQNGFDGSWERLIAARLRKDYVAGHSEAEVIVHAVGGVSDQKLMEAAKLITSSKIPENETK